MLQILLALNVISQKLTDYSMQFLVVVVAVSLIFCLFSFFFSLYRSVGCLCMTKIREKRVTVCVSARNIIWKFGTCATENGLKLHIFKFEDNREM